jgi:histidinol-phosphate aminotransferase
MARELLSLAIPGVRGLKPYEPGKPLTELEREYGIKHAIKLASNENPLGPGAKALAAIRAQLDDLGRYPDGNGFALKAALAHTHGIAPPQITLGNGSNEVLEFAARAFVLPENEVVYSQHAFAVYPLVTQAIGAKAVVTPVIDWGHDLEAMAAAINVRTRLVFVANPNNPTGTWIAADALERFLQRVPEHVVVVVDEAYYEYVSEPRYPNTIPWVARFPNLVVTRTFSKVHGLAGLRVGYGVSSLQMADLLNRVREPFNVNSLALAAAEAALADVQHVAYAAAYAGTRCARADIHTFGRQFHNGRCRACRGPRLRGAAATRGDCPSHCELRHAQSLAYHHRAAAGEPAVPESTY